MDGQLSRRSLLAGAALLPLAAACRAAQPARTAEPTRTAGQAVPGSGAPGGSPAPGTPSPTAPGTPGTPAQMSARATVPVLCYHQLRDWTAADSAYTKQFLVCPPAQFRAHLDALADGGWTTISPDQYLAHVETGAALPAQPVLLSFDDAQGTQATEALPQLVERSMTATFFAMTVVLDKPHWLSSDDLRRMDAAGMTVAAHTYDHHRVDRYGAADWALQLDQPRELLEKVLGKPVQHFAYPYGAWNAAAFPHLASAGYRTAFQLSDQPLDPTAPLDTLRRLLVTSSWTGPQLLAAMRG